uniref:Uncharacterized protein n=1 Tax=Arundo donax TaxID=35708 RepID=A0A0A9CBW8_ARUDO
MKDQNVTFWVLVQSTTIQTQQT